ITINGKEVLLHNFVDEKDNYIKIKGAENLKTNGLQKRLSVIKYIYNNTIQDENSVIFKIMNFVQGMLFFRSLKEANQYIGYKLGGELLHDIILNNGKLEDFNEFLKQFELNYMLVPLKTMSGLLTMGAKFENGHVVEFESICSSGTRTLLLFYCWMLHFSNLTLLVIDEFDAYYHYETSEKVLEIIHSFENVQSIVSTHSVTLMNTKLTRPDCCFILNNNKIENICNCTDKELRAAHNIEKMYREGNFVE
ncbi:MAG: AAA family ATPase, partial [Bacillota bacterium]|nr:AAA family ATPase [Bacillota bacterium]